MPLKDRARLYGDTRRNPAMASTLDLKRRTTDAAARRALGMPVCRVKRQRVPDTLDARNGPRPSPRLLSSSQPEVSLRIQTVEVMS